MSHVDSHRRLFPEGLNQIVHLAPKGGPILLGKQGVVVALAELERSHPGRDQVASGSSGRGIGLSPRQPVQRNQSPIVVESFA